jgi:hypothetical protein
MIAWWECQRLEELADPSLGRKPIPKVPSNAKKIPLYRLDVDREWLEEQKRFWMLD